MRIDPEIEALVKANVEANGGSYAVSDNMVWEGILEMGKIDGVLPIGLAALATACGSSRACRCTDTKKRLT